MKKKTFSLRPAQTGDFAVIQQLAYEIWPTWYASIISTDQIEYMLRNFYSPHALTEQAESGHRFFMAMENQKAVGFMSLSPLPGQEWKVEKLYLLSETRGRGYGKKMIEFAMDFARKQKAKYLILNVNRFNESRNFYFGLGFRVRQVVDIPLACFWLNDYVVEMKLYPHR